jgi:anti-sigma factor antagonist
MTRYLKNMEKEIIIDNQLDEVARIALFIEELGMSLQLPAGITMSLNLAIEEAVTNIIRYGYPSNKESENHPSNICCSRNAGYTNYRQRNFLRSYCQRNI